MVRYKLSNVTGARDYFAAAIELNPKHGPAHFYRAKCEIASGQFDAALADLDKAVRFGPKRVEVYTRRGFVNGLLRRGPAALADFTAAAPIDSLSPEAYRYRAAAYRELLNDSEAAFADATTAELLDAGPAESVPEGKLAAAVRDRLATARRVVLTMAVPEADAAHLTVYGRLALGAVVPIHTPTGTAAEKCECRCGSHLAPGVWVRCGGQILRS